MTSSCDARSGFSLTLHTPSLARFSLRSIRAPLLLLITSFAKFSSHLSIIYL